MFKSILKYCIFLIAVSVLGGCRQQAQNGNKLIAEVGNRKLYLSEISSVIPHNLTSEDSTVMADEYVRRWIRQELMLKKAEENLSVDLKNVNRELEEYRKSLIIFRYKNELMAQRMDTSVSNSEIMEYYLEYGDNFKLERNIVKAVFLKIPAEFADPEALKEMSGNSEKLAINELRDFCLQYAKGFDIFTDRWVDLERVMSSMPTNIEDPEQYLKKNQFIEFNDSSYYYLVAIHDYMLRNEQAPEEYVREDIKSLILNRRKIEFLKDLENNVFQEGMNKNSFKIYNSETDGM